MLFVYIDVRGNAPEVHLLPYDVFYVGLGSNDRCNDYRPQSRNGYHASIAAKHGMTRIRVFQHDDLDVIVAKEKELIRQLNTYHYKNPRGANFTPGGEKGARGYRRLYRRRLSTGHRAKIAESNRQRTVSDVTRDKIGLSNKRRRGIKYKKRERQ